jgi:hypothetical protein
MKFIGKWVYTILFQFDSNRTTWYLILLSMNVHRMINLNRELNFVELNFLFKFYLFDDVSSSSSNFDETTKGEFIFSAKQWIFLFLLWYTAVINTCIVSKRKNSSKTFLNIVIKSNHGKVSFGKAVIRTIFSS